MWEFFLKNSRFTYLLIASLILFGVYSAISIPKESAPEVVIPVGIVTTILPGAPASDVENLVTNEIERTLASSLTQVKSITSVSNESVSLITVEFEASADLDASIQDLKDAVDTVISDLPDNAEDPRVTQIDFVNQPITTISVSGSLSDAEFTQMSDKLESELESLTGVSKVEVQGVRTREITLITSPTALSRYDLTVSDVINGLRSANSTFPIGQIVTGDISYNVSFFGDIEDRSEVANIPIATRGGQPVYVRDIAIVDDGLSPSNSITRLSIDGKPSFTGASFDIYKQSGGDITKITKSVQEKLVELQAEGQLLHNLTIYTIQDAGADIAHDLKNLTSSGLQTVVMVMLVLVLMIGWREGLLAGLSIPLSFTIGFIGLYLSGNTINFISLFALILGIGVLVDAGIVMVEGINKNISDHPDWSKKEVTRKAVVDFASPITSGTLTTVAMFVGLFIVSGVTGQFISGIPFTLIFVLFASLLVAIGFIPLISSSFLKGAKVILAESDLSAGEKINIKIQGWYRKNIEKLITSKKGKKIFLTVIISLFFISLALIPAGLVKVVFFEQTDTPQIYIEIKLPEGSIKESTDLVVRQVEEVLYKNKDIIEAHAVTVGSGSAFLGGGKNEKLANITINLKDDRTITSTEFITKLRNEIPVIKGALITVSEPNNGPPTGSPIGVKLMGNDLIELDKAANLVADLLDEIVGVTNIQTSNTSNNIEYVLTLDKAKTAAAGLNPLVVSQTLRAAVYGTEATNLTTVNEDIPVVVRLNLTGNDQIDAAQTNRTTIDSLNNISIKNNQGDSIILSSLIVTSLRESSSAINHENQSRVVTVSADITASGNVIEINNELSKKIESSSQFPTDVSYAFGGEAEDSNQAFIELFLALIIGLVLMIAVLVLEFNSFRYTAYVLSIVPFSLIGILFGLAITGSALSFPSIMGFIALTGIIVNNSILLIDRMNEMRLKFPNKAIDTIVIDAAVSRLRPIILTSLTTIVGMVPLLYSDPIWVPLATAVIFGLTFSVIITLVLVPIIYDRWPGKLHD